MFLIIFANNNNCFAHDTGVIKLLSLPLVWVQQPLSHHRPLVPMPDDLQAVSKVHMFQIVGRQHFITKMKGQ